MPDLEVWVGSKTAHDSGIATIGMWYAIDEAPTTAEDWVESMVLAGELNLPSEDAYTAFVEAHPEIRVYQEYGFHELVHEGDTVERATEVAAVLRKIPTDEREAFANWATEDLERDARQFNEFKIGRFPSLEVYAQAVAQKHLDLALESAVELERGTITGGPISRALRFFYSHVDVQSVLLSEYQKDGKWFLPLSEHSKEVLVLRKHQEAR